MTFLGFVYRNNNHNKLWTRIDKMCFFLSLISGAKRSWPLKDHKGLILSQGIKTYRAQKKETNYGCNRLLMEKWWKFSFWLKVLTPRKDEMTSQKALLFAPVTLLILRPLFFVNDDIKTPLCRFLMLIGPFIFTKTTEGKSIRLLCFNELFMIEDEFYLKLLSSLYESS